jgi:diguanylate cyclase (GGDEF)-like protein
MRPEHPEERPPAPSLTTAAPRLDGASGLFLLGALLAIGAALSMHGIEDRPAVGGAPHSGNALPLLLALSAVTLLGIAYLRTRARLRGLQACMDEAQREHAAALEAALAENKARKASAGSPALRDELTGLFNRHRLEQFYQALARSEADQYPHGLVVIDIRDFADVNDSYGFATGDQLLRQVAALLLDSCTPRDIVAHFSADEFVVLMQWTLSEDDIAERLREFRRALNGKIFLAGYALTLRTRIGAARYPDNGRTLDGLYQAARRASRRAGEQNSDATLLFDDERDGIGEHRLESIEMLRGAIADGSVTLHYQPIVDLATMRISGAEGLARWQVDGETLWSPARFLGLAADSDQMTALNQRNLEQVIRQLQTWSEDPVFCQLYLSFNLSARDLLHSDIRKALMGFARAHPTMAPRLTVEIVETDVIENLAPLASVITHLRRAGVRVAIDDFGTGQSSLARLHELNVDLVKLDGSFIANLDGSPKNRSLVHAVIDISHKLDARVVAEFVETPVQAALLRDMGCDYAQGSYFRQAMPSEDFEALVAQLGGKPPASMAAVPWPVSGPLH